LTQILPTGFECGVLNGNVNHATQLLLSALLTAQFYSPAEIIMIDVDDNRLEVPKEFGATSVINNTDGKAVGKVMALTGNRGVDVAIEAIRIPVSLQ
jgi:alcohol dehydrogenase